MPEPISIFLSHAESDSEIASLVHKWFEQCSLGMIKVWQSSEPEAFKAGDKVLQRIHEELGNASNVVTLFTPSSCARPWLLYETAYIAAKGDRKVIPLLCGVSKEAIPNPLHQFHCYSIEDIEKLSQLIVDLLKKTVPNASPVSIMPLTKELCKNIDGLLASKVFQSKEHYKEGIFKLIKLQQFTRVLLDKLEDPNVNLIQVINYTFEVDENELARFRISGEKRVEVYKRSIIADLVEQQECNLHRLVNNSKVKPWDKRAISTSVSRRIDELSIPGLEVIQYFHENPPCFRAYIFDETEAIVSHYSVIDDPLRIGGSVYKGMLTAPNGLGLHVTSDSQIGAFVLDSLTNYIKSLKRTSHSWPIEEAALSKDHRGPIYPVIKTPCVRPLAVFLDLDGILYDSLPNYEIAWSKAFEKIDESFSQELVHRYEGRSGKDTIRFHLKMLNKPQKFIDAQIDQIHKKKCEVMDSLALPPLQKGALSLVQAIAASKLKIRVVTGSSRKNIFERIEQDFSPHITQDQIITGQMVRIGKPHPDPYLKACIDAEVYPHEAIVIENSPLGIESAASAGTFCIGVNTGKVLSDLELKEKKARVIFPDCEHLARKWSEIISILAAGGDSSP